MKRRLILITILSYLTFTVMFLFLGIGSLDTGIENAQREIQRTLRDVRSKKLRIQLLQKKLQEEGIRIYNRDQALEKLLTEVDRLRKEFKIEVRGDLRSQQGKWLMDVTLTFRPSSSAHLRDVVKKFSTMKEPIVFIRSVAISESPEGASSEVSIDLTFAMPFLERAG